MATQTRTTTKTKSPDQLFDGFVANFPHETIRPQQEEALRKIADGWDDHDNFLLDAPTGVGKSAIAEAVSKTVGRSYVLTSTKALQDQYQEVWNGIVNMKGRGNYQCAVNPMFRVDHAPCIAMPTQIEQCQKNSVCLYYNQRSRALMSQAMLTSYAYFVMSVECGALADYGAKPELVRDMLVLDEAHELDSILSDFMAFDVDHEMLSEYGLGAFFNPFLEDAENIFGDPKEMGSPIGKLNLAVLAKLDEMGDGLDRLLGNALSMSGGEISKVSKHAAVQAKEITAKRDVLDRLQKKLNRYDSYWMGTRMSPTKVRANPLMCKDGFGHYLGNLGHRVMAMSASLGDPNQWADEFGLDRGRTLSVRVGSPFPSERSPVVIMPVLQMAKNNIDASMPTAVEAIDELISMHPDEKGIVHTGNYKVTSAVLSMSKHRARLIGKDNTRASRGISNEELLRRHAESKAPTVLVSPSMHTGVDLKDDLSRFQIIAKLPWPSLEDPRIRKKSEHGDWYANEMIKKLVQASGRSTRSETDSAMTYVLDAAMSWVWDRHKRIMPDWFKARVQFH